MEPTKPEATPVVYKERYFHYESGEEFWSFWIIDKDGHRVNTDESGRPL